jgi:hypothetical protein
MLPFEDATEGVVQAAEMMFLNVNDSDVQVNFWVNCNVVLLLFSAWSVALASTWMSLPPSGRNNIHRAKAGMTRALSVLPA